MDVRRGGLSPVTGIRRLVDPPAAGARNMALDEALLESARRGVVTLRFYRWRPGCLSFGRNQMARDRWDPAAAAARGIDVVRRPTGGRAVYHDRELTYALAAPASWGSLREVYRTINRALCAGLVRLGLPVDVAPAAGRRAPAPGPRACFHDPVAGEITAGGRKLVGSAQWRDAGALLQHGSILLHDDQGVVEELRLGAGAGEAAGAAGLVELLGREPEPEELIEALSDGFEAELGTRPVPSKAAEEERVRAAALEERYRSPAWTWRR